MSFPDFLVLNLLASFQMEYFNKKKKKKKKISKENVERVSNRLNLSNAKNMVKFQTRKII